MIKTSDWCIQTLRIEEALKYGRKKKSDHHLVRYKTDSFFYHISGRNFSHTSLFFANISLVD